MPSDSIMIRSRHKRRISGLTPTPTRNPNRLFPHFAFNPKNPTIPPMQLLLHGTMTEAVASALTRHGHSPHKSEELGLPPEASASDILKAAKTRQWDIITNDSAFSMAPFETEEWFTRSIVYLQLPGGDVEQDDAVDRLFKRYKRLSPGRLYTVTGSRVKVRQLPGKH